MHFKITQQQVDAIGNIALEFLPGKHALPIVDIFRALPAIVEDVKEIIHPPKAEQPPAAPENK